MLTKLFHSELEAAAAKQRQREEEAEERRKARLAGGSSEKASSRVDSGAPRSALAGRPGWRGNEEGSAAASNATSSTTATSELPKRSDAYVIGSLRGRTAGQSLEVRSDSRPDDRSESRSGATGTYRRLALKPRTVEASSGGQALSNRSDSRPDNPTETRTESTSGQAEKWRAGPRNGPPSTRDDSPANGLDRNSSRFGAKTEETQESRGEASRLPAEPLPPTQKGRYVAPQRRNK